jgi:exosortase A-associated hydrolase 2
LQLYRSEAGGLIGKDARALRPHYLTGRAGRIFTIYFPPPPETPVRSRLLFFPPFAEEANRSRHVIAAFARGCAPKGIGVAVLDPYGTGDSDGDFSEGRWDIWRDDAGVAIDWLSGMGGEPIAIGGLRLGATLAADVAAVHPARLSRLVLWQPVTIGQNYLKQFLRIRFAADLAEGGGDGQGTKQLMEMLEAGQSVEVAGYDLAPALAKSIEALKLAALDLAAKTPVTWLEVAGREDAPLSPAAAKIVSDWRAAGIDVSARTIKDEAVWLLQARVEMKAFVDAAVQAMSEAT